MAITGRKPKPVEQRIKEGNIEQSPMPQVMLVSGRPAPGEYPPPPDRLPQAGVDAWNTIVPQLIDVGLVDRVDTMMLEAMCMQWARMVQAGRVVKAQGHLVRGPGGQLKEHPSLRTERDATARFMSIAEQYAMTPAARTRLGLAELHRRSLKAEFDTNVGTPELVEIEDDGIEDVEIVDERPGTDLMDEL